jgi:hypothetical protein
MCADSTFLPFKVMTEFSSFWQFSHASFEQLTQFTNPNWFCQQSLSRISYAFVLSKSLQLAQLGPGATQGSQGFPFLQTVFSRPQ